MISRKLEPDVLALVETVRKLPCCPGLLKSTPHTCPFDTKLERRAFDRRKLGNPSTMVLNRGGFYFFSESMQTPSLSDQRESYLERRRDIVSLMELEIQNRVSEAIILDNFVHDLKKLYGEDSSIACKAIAVMEQLKLYIMLACNCMLYLCDEHICNEYSARSSLESYKRKAGTSLLEMFNSIEMLMLQYLNWQRKGVSSLYEDPKTDTCRDVHRYAVEALNRSSEPWSEELACRLHRACLNEVTRARWENIPPKDRPKFLQLSKIAFQHEIVGWDEQQREDHARIQLESDDTPEVSDFGSDSYEPCDEDNDAKDDPIGDEETDTEPPCRRKRWGNRPNRGDFHTEPYCY